MVASDDRKGAMNKPPDNYAFATNRAASMRKVENLHGDARWMDADDLASSGLLDPTGILLGQTSDGRLLRFNRDGHVMVFAPTGAGKGVGFVQANLADYPGSVVVLDPKGENAIVSANLRRRMGQRVIILDPFGRTGMQTDVYNPLGALNTVGKDRIGSIIENLAEALIPVAEAGAKVDPHWPMGAKKFATFLMWWMVVHEPKERRNLLTMFHLAHAGYEPTRKLAEVMRRGLHPDRDIAELCVSLGEWYIGRQPKELSYFESQATNNLGWIGDFVWRNVLAGPPSPPLNLKDKDAPVTVYLVLPFDQINRYRPWLRIMVTDLLNCVYALPGGVKTPALFLMDEAYAGLGHMDIVFTAAAAVRSAGARLALIYQDIEQAEKAYGKAWASLVNNAGVTLFWSVAPLDTSGQQFISRACGHRTVPVPGQPTGASQLLIRPEQVAQLPADEIVAFVSNRRPVRFGRLDVRRHPHFIENGRSKLDRNSTYDEYNSSKLKPVTPAAIDYVPIDLSTETGHRQTGAEWANDNRLATSASMIDNDEALFLEYLSHQHGKYVFKTADGRYGYVDDGGTFVPVDAR